MNIRKIYKELLHKIESVCNNLDTTKSDNLMKIIKMTKLKYKFNCLDFWNNFSPNIDKPYSILNTELSNEGQGLHWIGVFQEGKTIYIYDSFSRKNIMNRFCEERSELGYRCEYVNNKTDQQSKQINCGIRSLLWLLFVQRYGIKQTRKI